MFNTHPKTAVRDVQEVLFAALAVLFVSVAAMALPATAADSASHAGTAGGGEAGVCAFNPLPEFPTWLINVTSTSWCDTINDSYHYKAFAPWEIVKPMLNMQ